MRKDSDQNKSQCLDVSNQIPRVNILGVGVTPVNLPQTIEILEQWRHDGRRDYALCTSVHGLVEAQSDLEIKAALNRSGLTTEDGMPLVWWCQRSGYPSAGRVSGTDLLLAMCEKAAKNGHRHYFYGGSPAVVEALVSNLERRFPGFKAVGYKSPPFRTLTPEEDAADIRAINETRPDFVWIGLGFPKQDKWIVQHLGKIEAAALLGVGAAFDFVAGAKQRAPLWMQRYGLEWLYRLATEPRRLAHRYLVYNSIFIVRALQQLTGWKTYARDW